MNNHECYPPDALYALPVWPIKALMWQFQAAAEPSCHRVKYRLVARWFGVLTPMPSEDIVGRSDQYDHALINVQPDMTSR